MASFEPQDFGLEDPPPRPTTPPVRRGFLLVLLVLCVMATVVYGIPYVAKRAGYAWEVGRSQAASEALVKLEKAGIVNRASALFRMATVAVAPAVVRVQTMGMDARSLGSGVIIDKERGFLVTNNHVIKDADQIVVSLSQGILLPARVVGTDPKSDLAVLQINGPAPAAAQWGDSNQLDIGDWVLAIGSPFGLDHTVTAGIVSATQRNDLRIIEDESFIQTDAAINPGNSGGPLVDLSGKVVGINTAIFSSEPNGNGRNPPANPQPNGNEGSAPNGARLYGNEGIGLAIPSSMAQRIVASIIKEGRVIRGYLGVTMHPVTRAVVQQFSLPQARGVLVLDVKAGSPAEKAGLNRGDVIVKLGEKDVADLFSLKHQTAGLPVGARVPLAFYRDGKLKTVDVTIAELPDRSPVPELGLHFREIPPGAGGKSPGALEIDHVVEDSPASRAGLRAGMRIVGIGHSAVATEAQYAQALAASSPGRDLRIHVSTPEGGTIPFKVTVPAAGRR